MRCEVLSGIRPSFPGLSQSQGQVTHVILTRSPLIHPQQAESIIVRLACVKHAASVHPEPGSNSPLKYYQKRNNNQFSLAPPCRKNRASRDHKKNVLLINPWQFRSHLHGGANATNTNQIFGINKLGTLLSSQAAGAAGTISGKPLNRSGATSLSYPSACTLSIQRSC